MAQMEEIEKGVDDTKVTMLKMWEEGPCSNTLQN